MHTSTILTSLIALASSSLAITIKTPGQNAVWDITQPNRIEWTSVSTDPSTINIQIVNFSKFPVYNKTIATGVSTSASFFVNPKNNVDGQTGTGFQINLSGTQQGNTGILAQSQQITFVSGGGSISTSSSSTSTGATTISTSKPTTSSAPYPTSGNATAISTGGTPSGTGSGGSTPSQFPGAASNVERNVGVVAAAALGLAALFA